MCSEDELWLIPKQRLAIKPPFEPRSHFKMDFKSGLSMIVRRVILVSLLTIETLSNNEGDGYENVTEKVNLLTASNLISRIPCQMMAIVFGVDSRTVWKFRKKRGTKEPDARAKLLLCQSKHIAFFAVLVAVAVHIKHQSSKIICGQQTIRSNGGWLSQWF